MDGAEMLDEVDAVAAQLVGQMFFLEGVAGNPIAVGQDRLVGWVAEEALRARRLTTTSSRGPVWPSGPGCAPAPVPG